MLIGALIFLVIAAFTAFYEFEGANPTFLLVAKVIMYFSLIAFLALLFTYAVSTSPPIPDDTSHRPL